jgi:hypothetical protein
MVDVLRGLATGRLLDPIRAGTGTIAVPVTAAAMTLVLTFKAYAPVATVALMVVTTMSNEIKETFFPDPAGLARVITLAAVAATAGKITPAVIVA